MLSHSVMSDSFQRFGLQTARLFRPWDFSGKNTGVGCHEVVSLKSRPVTGMFNCFLPLSIPSSSGGSVVKNMPANGGAVGLIPGLGRSPGEGNGNALQHSCLEKPMDGGA